MPTASGLCTRSDNDESAELGDCWRATMLAEYEVYRNNDVRERKKRVILPDSLVGTRYEPVTHEKNRTDIRGLHIAALLSHIILVCTSLPLTRL